MKEVKTNHMVESIYDLTPMQKGMLYHNMLNPESTEYVLQNVLRFKGEFKREYMEQSLKYLSRKYEVLRTLIFYRNVNTPKQVVLNERDFECSFYDYKNEDENCAIEKLNEIVSKDVSKGFDLEKDTLLRSKIVYISSDITYMIITVHHIIIDGWCLSFLLHDLLKYYEILFKGAPQTVIEDEIMHQKIDVASFHEYVKCIYSQDREEGLAYWEHLLQDYNQVVKLEAIEDISRENEDNEGVYSIILDEELSKNIKRFTQKNEITSSVFFETAWALLLRSFGFSDDIVFGKVVSGRQKDLRGIENAIGLYINTIPVRYKFKTTDRLIDVLLEAMEQECNSFSYDFCSLSEIQQRANIKTDLFQNLFVYENYYVKYEEKNTFANLEYEIVSTREKTNYDVSFGVFDTENHYKIGMMYNKSMYSEADISRFCRQMVHNLECILQYSNRTIEDIEFISDDDYKLILNEFNCPIDPSYRNGNIIELFEGVVNKYPDKVAVITSNRRITYSTLNFMANQIAFILFQNNIKPEEFVVIYGKKSLHTVAAILGIIKSGACFVPIDSEEPIERFEYKVNDCKPRVILISDDLNLPNLDFDSKTTVIYLKDIKLDEKLVIENPKIYVAENNLLYTIYTSGTTGNPKGVLIEHGSAANFCRVMSAEYEIGNDDKLILFASIAFDASIGQFLLAFTTGATLYIPDSLFGLDPHYIKKVIEREGLTSLSFPPQYACQLEPVKCRYILTAGSEANREVVQKIINFTDYINAYGPTEATICTTYWKCKKGSELPHKIPIGKPHKNYIVYILKNNKLCGIGMPGEIAIAGLGLARGYLNQEELTNHKFVNNPFGPGKMYMTGDLAKWLPDGNIEYLGRIDTQVKIRGYRIELDEVEAAFRKIEYIQDCVVDTIENQYGEACIVVYIVSNREVNQENLRMYIGSYLPKYMIPDYIIQIEHIPVTINGKIDKIKLSQTSICNKNEYIAPNSEIERKICEIFSDVLGIERIGINHAFIDNGGNSINAMRLVTLLNKEKIHVELNDIIQFQTPKEIAKIFTQKETINDKKHLGVLVSINLTLAQRASLERENPFDNVILGMSAEIDSDHIKKIFKFIVEKYNILKYKVSNSDMSIQYRENYEFYFENFTWDDNSLSSLLKQVNELGLERKEEALLISCVHTGKGNYIVISLNSVLIDEFSKLVIIDEFIAAYLNGRHKTDFISGHHSDNSFQNWMHKNNNYGEFQFKRLYLEHKFELDSKVSRKLLEGNYRSHIKTILENCIKKLWGTKANICLKKNNHRTNAKVGNYTEYDLEPLKDYKATYSILYTDEIQVRALNSGILYLTTTKTSEGGFTEFHIDVEISNGLIVFSLFLENNIKDKVSIVAPIIKEEIETFTKRITTSNSSIENDIRKSLLKDIYICMPYSVEKEYAVTSMQKIFMGTEFSTVCIGKKFLIGKYEQEFLLEGVKKIVNNQSVFRSFFSDFYNIIQETGNANINIPYLDLSIYDIDTRKKLIHQIEVLGMDIRRFKCFVPLAQQCIVKISENIHIIYLFAHHAVCDMLSIHIWKQLIENIVVEDKDCINVYKYSDFLEKANMAEVIEVSENIEQKFIEEFKNIKNNHQFSIVCQNNYVIKKYEKNNLEFALKLLEELINIYDKNYCGNIPLLFIEHGRDSFNSLTMGLFIKIYEYVYRHNSSSEINQIVQKIKLGDYDNVKNISYTDLEDVRYFPLINIVSTQMDYTTDLFNNVEDRNHRETFKGICIEVQFFNNAMRIVVKCAAQYKYVFYERCKFLLGEDIVIDS